MFNIENENLNNGYMYKKFMEKIESLEKENKEIMKLVNEANSNMRISLKDYVSIIKAIEKKTSQDEFIHHAEDFDIHYHRGLLYDMLKRIERIEAILHIDEAVTYLATDDGKIIKTDTDKAITVGEYIG